MSTVVDLPSGVRLALRTDSPVVELDVHTRVVHMVGGPFRPPVFQAIVDGELLPDEVVVGGSAVHVDRRPGSESIEFEEGSPVTLRWDGLGTHDKSIEIWFPTGASVEIRGLRVAADASVGPAATAARRWTHYGSSISHCMDVDRPLDAWPAIVARTVGLELTSFGFGGQCQLDPFMGRVIRDHPADVISLKLGINLVNAGSMTQRTFTPAVHGLLDAIRDGQPDTPVLVVSPIFCPSAEQNPGPTTFDERGMAGFHPAAAKVQPFGLTLEWIRSTLSSLVTARQAAGDANLHYLNGLDLLGDDEGSLLYDALHPSPKGYRLMGERFAAAAFGEGGPLAG